MACRAMRLRCTFSQGLSLVATVSVGAFPLHTLPLMRSKAILLTVAQGERLSCSGADRVPREAVAVNAGLSVMCRGTAPASSDLGRGSLRRTPIRSGVQGQLHPVGGRGKPLLSALRRFFLFLFVPLLAASAFPYSAAAVPWHAPWHAKAIENQAYAASTFFFNLLTPAALIAAGALQDAFIFVNAQNVEEKEKFNYDKLSTAKWQRLTNAYCFLMIIAFGLQLMTLFMGTIAGCRMLGGNYNPYASNTVEMLVREFEWDYVAVRTQFVTGILAFILAQALRVYKELHQREFLARSVMLFLLFCACQCLCFFNAHLNIYGTFLSLFSRYVQLAFGGLMQGGVLAFSTAALLVSCMIFLVLSIIEPDGDGELANDGLKEMWSTLVGEDAQQKRPAVPAKTPGPYAAAVQAILARFRGQEGGGRREGQGEDEGSAISLLPPSKK